MTRRRRIATILIALFAAEQIFLPIPSAHADLPSGDSPAAFGFPEEAPSAQAPGASPKADSDDVTATGALQYALPLRVPPGRNGAAPSLALAYSSGSAGDASPVGAGWSLPQSAVRRSSRHGTPRIDNAMAFHYSDTENGLPIFERDGTELVFDPMSPPDVGSVYRDRIDRTFAKSIFHSLPPSYWLVIERDGTRRYYGNVPDQSLPQAVLQDDLGISEWELVRSVDPFGNVVDYEYVQGTQTGLSLQPLLSRIQYGKNLTTGYSHHARVDFVYTQTPRPLLVDHGRGHIYLDRVLSRIDVTVLPASSQPVRSYFFDIGTSPSSTRWLLRSVREQAGTLSGPTVRFEYTRNDGYTGQVMATGSVATLGWQRSPALSQALHNEGNVIGRAVMRVFTDISGAAVRKVPWADVFGTPTDPDGWVKWSQRYLIDGAPDSWTREQRFVSAPGIPSAWRLVDLDGDGDTDVLYHPTFVAGFGLAQPWMSFLQLDGGNFSSYFDQMGGADALSMSGGASDYVDIDLDGAVDRVKLMPNVEQDKPSPFTNPHMIDLCNWWFHHAGGYTDPDPRPEGFPPMAAAYLVDNIAARLGVRTFAWDDVIAQTAGEMAGYTSRQMPSLLIGGIPSRLGFCYDWSAANPFTEPGFGGTTGIGSFLTERGRLRNPAEPRNVHKNQLQHYPNIGSPAFIYAYKPGPLGYPLLNRVDNKRTVYAPMVDLDHDGVPELVVLKSQQGDIEHFGAGVWRIRDYDPIHERDDTQTHSRFVSTLMSTLSTSKSFNLAAGIGLQRDDACPDPQALVLTPDPEEARRAVYNEARAGALSMMNEGEIDGSDFEQVDQALRRLTATDSRVWGHIHDWLLNRVQAQKFLSEADWVSMFMDVNGDGLPDFVVAKGATCHYPYANPPQTDHQAGFDVYLNRGDRFETSPAPGLPWAEGPFDMLRNWTSSQMQKSNFADVDRFPLSAMAFTDVDGDGFGDAIMDVLINYQTGFGGGWSQSPACTSESIPGKVRMRCAWRGSAAGWIASPSLAQKLPSPGDEWTLTASVLWGGPVKGFDDQMFGDRMRWADLDNDGMPDFLSARSTVTGSSGCPGGGPCYPEEDITRAYHSTAIKPDLLVAVDNGLGARTTVQYEPARRTELSRVPMVPWVVRSVAHHPQIDGSDQVVADTRSYAYADGVYDFAEREFLGFRSVTERRPLLAPDGQQAGVRVQEREYYQFEQSAIGRPNPLKGVLRSQTRRSDPEGQVETVRTEQSYEVVNQTGSPVHRVRKTVSETRTCTTAASCAAASIVVRDERSNFDDYDNPRAEVVTATRQGLGDGYDGTIVVTHARSYLNDVTNWIIGLPEIYVRSSAGDFLAAEVYGYDRGKMIRKLRQRRGIEPGCNDSGVGLFEEWTYNPDGTLAEARNNNDQIVGGAQPRSAYAYDAATHSLVAQTTDFKSGTPGMLVRRYDYDLRFGVVETSHDPNGLTRTVRHDSLGRPSVEMTPDGEVARRYTYDWSTRPISITTRDTPGSGQPEIERTQYLDGLRRPRQTAVRTASGAVIESWTAYDSFGNAAEGALPIAVAARGFRSRSQIGSPLVRDRHDVAGRVLRHELADGRVISTTYALGGAIHTDAKGTPRRDYLDALGRLAAVEEYYRPAGSTVAFTPVRTLLYRNGDGDIVATVDPDGNVRTFDYNELHELVRTDAPHAATAAVQGSYHYCFDGRGDETRTITPEGRQRTEHRDELGRVVWVEHTRPEDDVQLDYDDPSALGLGKLASVGNATGTWRLGYDQFGNVAHRSFESSLGTDAAPWRDGRFEETAQHDRLGRATAATLPYDSSQMAAQVQLTFDYDERGLARKLYVDGQQWISLYPYSASGKPTLAYLHNNTWQQWAYEALNDRLYSIAVWDATGGYAYTNGLMYDDNDNPYNVRRFYGVGVDGDHTISEKINWIDSLDRLESSFHIGIEPQYRWYNYSYSPAGNLLLKDGLSYRYDGRDPHAVSARLDASGQPLEHYVYDNDGNMTAVEASDGSGWLYAWNQDDKLVTATRRTDGRQTFFRYDGYGNRVLTRGGNGADVLIGALELRGRDNSPQPGEAPAYYNLDLGLFHAQLALRQANDGRLARASSADRYYYRDYQGSTALVMGPDGLVVSTTGADGGRLEYAPYGETSLAATDASVANIHARYTGKELDPDTGLTYFGARYQSATLGRWTARDPSALVDAATGAHSSQAANLYAFADNNPITKVDPDGRLAFPEWVIEACKLAARIATKDTAEVAVGSLNPAGAVAVAYFSMVGNAGGAGDAPPYRNNEIQETQRQELRETAQLQPEAGGAAARPPNCPPPPAEKPGKPNASTEVPNPWGRRGSPEHQEKVDEIARDIEARGMYAQREYKIETPGGQKGVRYVDVVGINKLTCEVEEMHQVGRNTKGGEPVSRENKALDDIERATGKRPEFHEYIPKPRTIK